MKYIIKSLDTVKGTDRIYIVVEFLSDAGELLRVEDFVIGRPAINRYYAGPPLYDKDTGEWIGETKVILMFDMDTGAPILDKNGKQREITVPVPPDPSMWVEEKNDVAAEIEAILDTYIKTHPEMDDPQQRDAKYTVNKTNAGIEKDKSDPAGHLSDPSILALVGREKIVVKAKIK